MIFVERNSFFDPKAKNKKKQQAFMPAVFTNFLSYGKAILNVLISDQGLGPLGPFALTHQ